MNLPRFETRSPEAWRIWKSMQEKRRMRTTAAVVNGRERGGSGSRDRGSSGEISSGAWTQAEAKVDAGGTSTADTDWPSDHLKSGPRCSCFGQFDLGEL